MSGNVILCGFMGCGKTTVGRALARRISADFIDMDEYLEEREQMTIPEMFAEFGEQGFREREHKAVLELSKKRGIVLAAGGGALVFERNARPLTESGVIIFLSLDFDECYERIKDSDRPIVREKTKEQLRLLHNERGNLYRAASELEIRASGAPDEITDVIITELQKHSF